MVGQGIFAKQGEALAQRAAVIASLDKPHYGVVEAAKILRRSKQHVYDLIRAGELHALEVGARKEKRIAKAELARALVPAPLDFMRRVLRERPE